jgi:hypothetical protein
MMERHTAIVQGALAYGMRRTAAALTGECGLQILSVSQMAARLAGGFLHLATAETIEPAIREALEEGGFQDLEGVRQLPGMTRAIAKTFRKAWHADLRLQDKAPATSGRIADLVELEDRVKRRLPPAALLPAALRDAALARIAFASVLLGPVRIEGVHFVEPVWRPLLNALVGVVPIAWDAPPSADTSWFRGIVNRPSVAAREPELVTCADPKHEAVEALRWVRGLLASGNAKASEIAISAVSTEEWDEHILSLSAEAGLRIHFPHGVPCLSTRDGQRCAALADLLLNGLSQARVRRLFALAAGQGTALDTLPQGWLSIPRRAALGSAVEWKRALEAGPPKSAASTAHVLSLLTILEKGAGAAGEAADALLRGRSRRLWDMATRAAPAAALDLTLKSIRVIDERDPGDSVAWCPAWQLAAAPRPYVRLLGLTSRVWPRRFGDDPVLPNHIVRAEELDCDPPAETDLRVFQNVKGLAAKCVVFSRSRRNPQGSLIGASPLFPSRKAARALARARTPEHALTESDRLSARPQEAAQIPLLKSAGQCWRDWHQTRVTVHDGLVLPAHPVVIQAIRRVQSPTSLTRLLRDPLGFIWQYAFGWHAQPQNEQPLTLPPDEFGRLVHELLRRTVDSLEPLPGFTVAQAHEIETALADAAKVVTESWPIERPVPPHVLWVNTVRQAAEMSLAGLTLEKFTEAGTRSWTEVPFGQTDKQASPLRELPWNPSLPVCVPGTQVAIRGSIDRVDLRAGGVAVRVTDYKTGERPAEPSKVVIGGGAELQRVLYALACRQLLSENPPIRARLIYLKGKPAIFSLLDPDQTIEQVSKFVRAACAVLEAGKGLPGLGAEADTNDFRFALPASPGYLRRKRLRFREALGELTRFWSAK